MKKAFLVLVCSLSIASFAHALEFARIIDTTVSASLVEGYSSARSPDKVISAGLVTVFRGGAAGMSSVIITLGDQSDNSGSDLGHTVSYELRHIVNTPKNIVIKKLSNRVYRMSFKVSEITMDEDGNFKYPEREVVLTITLNNEGAISSVVKK